jgi:hypothetical protein
MKTKPPIHLEDELRTVAEDVKAHAEQLVIIEEVKSKLPVDDPRQGPLSERAQDLAGELVVDTAAETALVHGRRGNE